MKRHLRNSTGTNKKELISRVVNCLPDWLSKMALVRLQTGSEDGVAVCLLKLWYREIIVYNICLIKAYSF